MVVITIANLTFFSDFFTILHHNKNRFCSGVVRGLFGKTPKNGDFTEEDPKDCGRKVMGIG
ncbi:hypothetical protein [Paucihalobacter sp.]|uniref:hypothetical protein n=1 Tax=Paucihalobacter sp. TaxID=2850405 RepID=UPI003D1623D2